MSWYKKGLNFKCTECGKCCSGTPGYVWVNEEEVGEIASFLKISVSELKQRYLRRVGSRYSLTELRRNFDCVFLQDKKCRIYGARPTQCRTYPFWPQNLLSPEAWQDAAKTCEGISSSAPSVDVEVIEEQQLIQIKRNEKN